MEDFLLGCNERSVRPRVVAASSTLAARLPCAKPFAALLVSQDSSRNRSARGSSDQRERPSTQGSSRTVSSSALLAFTC